MADTTIMRRNNLQTILEAIDRLGTSTTFDLTEATQLSLATISRVTSQLKTNGLILQQRKQTSEPGRKPEIYQLNHRCATSVYFNLKSGCLQSYLLDFGGQILTALELPVCADLTAPEFLQLVTEQLAQLAASQPDYAAPLAIYLTLPGQQDLTTGAVCRIPNFPGFEGVRLQDMMESALSLPCLIGNTARLTAWGHFLARKHDVRNLIYLEITGDCGIGAGLVLDGRMYEDSAGLAGEVGDMIVQLKDRSAPTNRGALEEDAGLVSILQKAQTLLPGAALQELEQAAADGNEAVLTLLCDATRSWAAAIVNLCAMLSPDKIVVGGAVCEENTLIRNLIDRHLKAMYYRPVSVAFAPKGCLCHTEGAADVLKDFLFCQELDRIVE